MFDFFYKYSHYFYLPSDIYNSIEENNNIKPKRVTDFFKNKGLIIRDKAIKVESTYDFLYSITIKLKTTDEKHKLISILDEYRELFPPWKVFPNMFQGSPRWNQGVQEDYSIHNWLPFWKSLNDIKKNEHIIKYSCPLEWSEWLEENNNVL